MSFSETVWCTYIYINIYIYIIWSHVATLGTLMNQTAVKRCPLEKPPTCLRLWIACIRIIGSIRCLKQSRDWPLFHCYTAIPYKIGKLATLKKITLGEDVPFHHVFFHGSSANLQWQSLQVQSCRCWHGPNLILQKKKSAVIWCKVAKPCKTLAALGNEFEQVFGKLSAFDDGAASFNYIDIRCTVSIFLLVFTACLACVHVYGCF